MGDAKIPDLYAYLGITSQHASQNEIQIAYERLILKFEPEMRLGHVQPNAVELIKVGLQRLFASLPPSSPSFSQILIVLST